MHSRQPGRWIAGAAALLAALVVAAPAHAQAHYDEATIAAVAAIAVLAPAEVGVAVPIADPSGGRLVLGWSLQFPFSMLFPDSTTDHRAVVGVDLLPRGDVSWRGRLGYRFGQRHFFAGAGVGVDGAGANLSPELGVKFLHAEGPSRSGDIDMSLHLLARAEIAPGSGQVRGATVLLGWNIL